MHTVLKSALCAALTMVGTAAVAVDHEIRMERYGYFPKKIYVQAGDTITFVNRTPNWARVYSYDSNDNYNGYNSNQPCIDHSRFSGSEDGFASGWMSVGSTWTYTVTSCIEQTILPPYIWQYSFDDDKYRAELVFGSAPSE